MQMSTPLFKSLLGTDEMEKICNNMSRQYLSVIDNCIVIACIAYGWYVKCSQYFSK